MNMIKLSDRGTIYFINLEKVSRAKLFQEHKNVDGTIKGQYMYIYFYCSEREIELYEKINIDKMIKVFSSCFDNKYA
jgi:hypothetical protein